MQELFLNFLCSISFSDLYFLVKLLFFLVIYYFPCSLFGLRTGYDLNYKISHFLGSQMCKLFKTKGYRVTPTHHKNLSENIQKEICMVIKEAKIIWFLIHFKDDLLLI